jgi:RHS repeat-associated protein
MGQDFVPLGFPGQIYDPETGFYYNFQRYYDPETSRYISQDPLRLAAGPNPQSYVPNPVTWLDPLGLMACNIRVSTEGQDWGTKGAHVHVGNKEVRIFPDDAGGFSADGIRLSNGSPTTKEVQAAVDAIRSDKGLRNDLIEKARATMTEMNNGSYGMQVNKGVEMMFLIKALERI